MFQIILAFIVVAFTAFYLRVKYRMTYWRRQGVAEDPGTFPFGGAHIWGTLRRTIPFTRMTDRPYKEFPEEKVVGMYDMFGSPALLLRDLDLAKRILIKDFVHFRERKRAVPEGASRLDPKSPALTYLARMLVEIQGKQWKHTRASLTPIFTGAKLRTMLPLIHAVADQCDAFLECKADSVEGAKSFDTEELMRKVACDLIISTGFGYQSDSIKNPDNIFRQNAEKLLPRAITLKQTMTIVLFRYLPSLSGYFSTLAPLEIDAQDFFADAISKIINKRRQTGERWNDFIDITLDILRKEAATTSEETPATQEKDQKEMELILISNNIMMFLAGFSTVSSTLSAFLYHLAKNQDCQETLYKEIKEAVENADTEKLDYETVTNLQYMEMSFQENMRMSPFVHLERYAVADYKIPNTEIIIPKNTCVRFPSTGISKDPKYFPEPHRFNPENFNAQNKAERHPLTSGGFGHGPRNCIAQRFATMEVKIIIARILTRYRVVTCDRTVPQLIPDPTKRFGQCKGDIWLAVERR